MTHSKRQEMPHQTDQMFLTDAGFETSMLFHKGFDMPHFAFFPMLRTADGRAAMKEYFAPFMETARQNDAGFILDTNTWRANPDWATLLGYDADDLAAINREAVAFAGDLRTEFGAGMNVLINGVIGPRGDGYNPAEIMTAEQAEDYHGVQVGTFADSGADMVSALTMTNVPEAVGVARAAGDRGLACVISFTLETDGRLPTGQTLAEAIAGVDAACLKKPAYYMVNCVHPDHFGDLLELGGDWIHRIHGLRANASRMSHAELDECDVLDDGNPQELGQQYVSLTQLLPNLNVFGGCCGTDHRHVAQICDALHAA
ncbi:homocysteine S-methyltransferase family protein [Aliiroseovarius sp. S1339]|uniref:homocysteine S-methyltransferase family protein n=1 Tax=Aliiroseovarius sp. S1339 TaxID=2936990 RepID=UPI0020BD8F7F|nr:homocysteine S-methyltransferase family protein [Aliiroseovarius sp. S1339]MCK8462935.1 homocysteine S-methyltransferase family protein [Aliiroseovarius sp. S1339]